MLRVGWKKAKANPAKSRYPQTQRSDGTMIA